MPSRHVSAPSHHLDAQSLRSFLISCPNDILAACTAVESFLFNQAPETALDFFRLCFPLLLQRLFGFHESASSGGWIWEASVSRNEAVGKALLSLLSPTGALFSALLALDRENAVQFLFPIERLPHWVRRLLSLDRGATVLCQVSDLFKNRIEVDASGSVHLLLDLFEYYMFWFAYYAVCQDSGSGPRPSSIRRARSDYKPIQVRSLGKWVSSLQYPYLGNTTSRHDLYLQLLHLYLLHFLQPSSTSRDRSQMGQVMSSADTSHGRFLLMTLVEFWLKSGDFWPMPPVMRQSLQLSQIGGIAMGSFPPAMEVCDGLRLVISHVNSHLIATFEQYGRYSSNRGLNMDSYVGTSGLFLSSPFGTDDDFSSDLRLLRRPLYRFICCALLFWPTGTPARQAWHVINVWLDYLQPWISHPEGKSGTPSEPTCSEDKLGREFFSARWHGYVTRNYPFYTSLLVHFFEFALKFIHADPEAVLEMTAKVLSVLTGSSEMLQFIKRADCDYHNSLPRRVDPSDSSPWKMQWEEITTLGDLGMQDPMNTQVLQQRGQPCLFGSGENGVIQIFQMLILQAEVEIQFMVIESRRVSTRALEVIKDASFKIFDSHPIYNPTALHSENQQMNPEQDMSRALGRHTFFDVKYRGDWMRRPIESTEVAWLARLLVKFSDSINSKLDLVGPEHQEQAAKISCDMNPQIGMLPTDGTDFKFTELIIPSGNPSTNLCFLDIVQAMKAFIYNCCSVLCSQFRRQGWRVNLRFMAKKPTLLLLLLTLLWAVRKN